MSQPEKHARQLAEEYSEKARKPGPFLLKNLIKKEIMDAHLAGYAAGRAEALEEAAKVCEDRDTSMWSIAYQVYGREFAIDIRQLGTPNVTLSDDSDSSVNSEADK